MSKPRVIVVAGWDGPVVVRRLADDEPDPSPYELAAIARAYIDAGDRDYPGEPALSARVVESFTMPVRDGIAAGLGPATRSNHGRAHAQPRATTRSRA